MIIMLIFLILTVAFLVGTAIYLNKKKNNVLDNIKINDKQNFTDKKSKKKNRKKLANILQLKIKDNIICLGNRYSTILKIGNIDYNMLSNNEQESIENILIQTALSIDYPVQFFSTTEYIDTSKIIALIKSNKSKSYKIQEYQKYLIQYLQNLMENRSISIITNYVIISYDGIYENAIEELNRKTLSFKGSLLRANIICDVLNEDELYNLIYRELNKNSALNISSLKEGGKNLYVGKKQETKTKRNRHF